MIVVFKARLLWSFFCFKLTVHISPFEMAAYSYTVQALKVAYEKRVQ